MKNDPFEIAEKYEKQRSPDAGKSPPSTVTAVGQAAKSKISEPPLAANDAPACFNCGAVMTATTDIAGRALWECRSCAVGDGTGKPDGIVGDGASVVDQILDGGKVVAVLICSKVFDAHLWLALRDDFNPGDGLAVFYPDELPFLATKDAQTLRKIYETKLAFGPGSRVRQ